VNADMHDNQGTLSIGGAVGSSSGSTMRGIVVSGGMVSFDRPIPVVSDSSNVGGVTGFAENSNMEACSFTGDVTGTIYGMPDDHWVSLGGLIGYCNTTSGGKSYINNCRVRGNIQVFVEHGGNKDIGGVLGVSSNNNGIGVTITNCFFEEGSITAACSSGMTEAGGFCGAFLNTHHMINNCGVMAGTVKIQVATYGNYIHAGGFVSSFESSGTMSNCFSRAHVVSTGNGDDEGDHNENQWDSHHTGGFTGYLGHGSTLSSCYATGTVRSVHTGDRQLNAGGLVGFSFGTIENCYALGDVLADKTEGAGYSACAGGLVGCSIGGTVRKSFSAGQVIAQSAESAAYAGGVAGYCGFNFDTSLAGVIIETAALGGRVTAAHDPILPPPSNPQWEPYAGRITGFYDSHDPDDLTINYANYKMLAGTGAYQTRITEAEIPEGDTGIFTLHGEDITIGSHTVSEIFWNSVLGFKRSVWNFGTVVGRGYPILNGLAGQ
jgi:ribosomal protein L18